MMLFYHLLGYGKARIDKYRTEFPSHGRLPTRYT
jgi:hypothetical protein